MNTQEFRKLYEQVLKERADDRVVWLIASDEEIVASRPTNIFRVMEEDLVRIMRESDLGPEGGRNSTDFELELAPDAKKFLYVVNVGQDDENEAAWVLSNNYDFLKSVGWILKKTNYR